MGREEIRAPLKMHVGEATLCPDNTALSLGTMISCSYFVFNTVQGHPVMCI